MNKTVELRVDTYYFGITSYYSDHKILVDYTGRWKIVKNTDDYELFIECFYLEEIEVEKEVPVNSYKISVEELLVKREGWLRYFLPYKRVEKVIEVPKLVMQKVKETKIHARVRWVPSSYISLKITEEFPIQECAGCYE